MKLFIDLETRSRIDLRQVGAYRYAEHPSTHVHCVAWSLGDDGEVHLWKQGDDLLGTDEGHEASRWLDLVRRGYHRPQEPLLFVAHNVEFEKQILRRKFNLDTKIEQWDDTAARAARMSLPRSLEEAGEHLGLDVQKDVEGSRVMMKLARARRVSKENRDEFWNSATKPEDFERLYAYCKDDVRTMRAMDLVLPSLSETEREVWMLTVRMNERGLKSDTASIPLALAVAKKDTERHSKRFMELVGLSPNSPHAAAKFGLPSLDKAHVREALKTAKPGSKRHEALTIRKLVSRSSVKKLHAFENRTTADGRVHGTLVYAGAERTLRWSGAGVQPQNFPKGMGEASLEAFDALRLGLFEETYSDPMGALSDILRGFFVGPYLVGDFAQIEARVLAWLAGQEDLIEVFRTGGDPYSEMASEIFGRPINKKSTDPSLPSGVTPRFIGKTVILGAGYGLGGKKFCTQIDKQFDVQIEEAFAERCIRAFRRRFSKIPALWSLLDKGMIYSINNNSERIIVGPLRMGNVYVEGRRFAYIELPNGRRMFYAYPKVVDGRVEYLGRNLYKGGAWERVTGYGGKWAENIVQALSRDLLAGAMLRLDRAGFHLVLTVHDEVVAEDEPERLKEFEEILTEVPIWAPGLPLAVESFACTRYRK